MRVKLSDITHYSKGSQINREDLIDTGEYIYLNGGINPSGRWTASNVDANTITISEGGNSSGYINYITEPFWCGAHCYYLFDGPKNTKYLYYALKSQQERLFAIRSGACMPNIKKADLGKFEFEFDYDEKKQDEVVSVLSSTENIINNRKKELEKLDELIRARFVEMFGDPDTEWPLVTIAEICSNTRTGPFGSSLHHDEFVDEGVFVLGIDNAVENKFSYNRMRYVTEEKYQQLKRYTVYPGDVIITIMGTVGRAAVIPEDMPKAINTKHLACLSPNFNVVDSYFLCNAFQIHPEIKRQLQEQTKGAIMAGLNLTVIRGLKFKLPPLERQKQFVEFYKQVNKSKVAIQAALDKTQLLFDSLMQKYFG